MLGGEPSSDGLEPAALARRLGLPLRSSLDETPGDDLLLVGSPSGLELWSGPNPRHGRARVDFGKRQRGRPGENLRRAVGRQPGRVIDATAGFAADAFTLATLGHRVLAWERSPILVALIEDGLRRALADPDLRAAAGRLEIQCGDSLDLLPRLDERPDAVYIDPMYPAPERPKTALPPLEIQLLRRLLGGEPGAEALLASALATGAGRVVLKRPPGAPELAGPLAAQHAGKLARYDVYQGEAP